MTDKWLDCFSKWETGNQMVFSVIMLIAGLIVIVLFGLWANQFLRLMIDALGAVRGKKQEEQPKNLRNAKPLSGIDWAREQKSLLEEQKQSGPGKATLDGKDA